MAYQSSPNTMGSANVGSANTGSASPSSNAYSDIGIGAGLGGLLGGFFSKNPMDAANPYFSQALQQMYGLQQQLPGYFSPYMQAGQQALPQLQQQYSSLLSDPAALMNKIGGSFQSSPGYEFQKQQSIDAANKAAAASGMAGSPEEQQQVAQTSGQLANQDYYNYLSKALGLYQTGLGGEQNLGQMGLSGAGQLSQGQMGLGANIANILGSQAQLAAAQTQAQNQSRTNEASGIGGFLGGLMQFI